MKSESESSCAPKLEVEWRRRATRPSSTSKIPATMIEITAASYLPEMAKRIAVIPAVSASRVSTLGMTRLIERLVIRRTRMRGGRSRRSPTRGGRIMVDLPSMHDPPARRLLRARVGDDGLAADHALADDDERRPVGRQVDVGAAAEADEAEALAGDHLLALAQVALDAPRDEAGDLDEGDVGTLARRHA